MPKTDPKRYYACLGVEPFLSLAATLARIAELAASTSAAFVILGKVMVMGRSRRGGTILSRQSRMATMSPPRAASMARRVSFSTSPSSKLSAAIVAL